MDFERTIKFKNIVKVILIQYFKMEDKWMWPHRLLFYTLYCISVNFSPIVKYNTIMNKLQQKFEGFTCIIE
jgi:hypothetical protein